MSSPAALFLSAFATTSSPLSRDDNENEVVGGYSIGPVIGYGATSTIRKAYNAADRDAESITAVKIIYISDLATKPTNNKALAKVRRTLLHEESIWASLSHEHILPLFTAHHSPDAFYFFTLYCPAGSLFDILKRDGTPALLQDDAGMMFRQVVRGLRYLHEEARLVHRDIKLENVLVDEMGLCKIADFGTAKPISSHFYHRSSPTSAVVSVAASRSHSRSRPFDEFSEPDLEKDDWVDEFPATPHSSSSTSSSNDDNDNDNPMIHRASSLSSPRPPSSHQNRFHRNSTTSYTHTHTHSHTLPPSSSTPLHANFRYNNNTKPKSKSKHTRFQPGSLPYASPELLLLPHPAAVSVQTLGQDGHRNKSRSRSKSANRNGNSINRSKSRTGGNHRSPYAKKNHNNNNNNNRYQPHPGQDIWALGVLLYALLTGKLPFSDRFEPRLQMKILSGHFTPPPDIGRGAERILYGCLDKNVSTRWTIAMVDEVAWGVGWGREGDEVIGGGGSDDDDDDEQGGSGAGAFGGNASTASTTNTNPTAAEQPDRGFVSEALALALSEEPKTKMMNGATITSAGAFLYDDDDDDNATQRHHTTTSSNAHAVTFVDEPEFEEDLYAAFDDDNEEVEEEGDEAEEKIESPSSFPPPHDRFDFESERERGRGRACSGRKGIPLLSVPIPRAR